MAKKKINIRKGIRGIRKKFRPKKYVPAWQRARRTRSILSAAGIMGGQASQAGPGRPKGSYKYRDPETGKPISVFDYKRLQAMRRVRYQQFQQRQLNVYRQRGITPEQVQQKQIQRTIQQGPPLPIQVIKKGDEAAVMVDEEVEFKRWDARQNVSPNTQRILTHLRQVQTKADVDNIRQQRIHEERRIVQDKANLMNAHTNMVDVTMDFTGTDDNVLQAPNVFREDPTGEDNILRQKRLNIMQTKEAGNNLRFGQ